MSLERGSFGLCFTFQKRSGAKCEDKTAAAAASSEEAAAEKAAQQDPNEAAATDEGKATAEKTAAEGSRPSGPPPKKQPWKSQVSGAKKRWDDIIDSDHQKAAAGGVSPCTPNA